MMRLAAFLKCYMDGLRVTHSLRMGNRAGVRPVIGSV